MITAPAAIKPFYNINFSGQRKNEPTEGFGFQKLGKDFYIKRTELESGAGYDTVMRGTAAKRLIKRCGLLTTPNEDGGVVLENSKGKKTVLSRPLTVDEVGILNTYGFLFKDEKVKTFAELIDNGADADIAAKILTYGGKDVEKIKMLTTSGEDGSCTIKTASGNDIVLTRPLSTNEVLFLISAKNKKVSDENIQTYINLKDECNLSDADAFNLAHKPRLAERFYTLITPDGSGEVNLFDKDGNGVKLKRALEPDETICVLETETQKLPSYITILDMGVEVKEAYRVISNAVRLQRFLSLTQADEDGTVTLVNKSGEEVRLERALSPDEALIAMQEGFTNQKIQEQLTTNGKVTSTKRRYDRFA